MNARLQQVGALREQIQTLLTEEYRDLVRACFKEHPEFVKYHDICGSKAFTDKEGERVFWSDDFKGSKSRGKLFDFLNEYEDFVPDLGTERMKP